MTQAKEAKSESFAITPIIEANKHFIAFLVLLVNQWLFCFLKVQAQGKGNGGQQEKVGMGKGKGRWCRSKIKLGKMRCNQESKGAKRGSERSSLAWCKDVRIISMNKGTRMRTLINSPWGCVRFSKPWYIDFSL
jgi:hypothetical protein